MAYSYVVYTGNGSTTQFAITFPYIRKEHVKVYVNYVDTAYTYVNDTTVQLAAAPASPLPVEVRRITPLNNVLVDYTDGSTLAASDLDTSNLQHLYSQQEIDDGIKQGVFVNAATGLPTANSQQITFVANPTSAQDAATKTYVDTADALKVAKAGDTMTGNLSTTGTLTAQGITFSKGTATNTDGIALGSTALSVNTTGINNNAFGMNVLSNNTIGEYNNAFGFDALRDNISGNLNTAFGDEALKANNTGSFNAGFGDTALKDNTSGSHNTAIGFCALQNCTIGTGNSVIGSHFTGVAPSLVASPVFNITTQNNRVAIGSTAVTNAYIQVAWTVVSDARDKTNLSVIPHGLDFVKQLKPTAFQFKLNRESEDTNGPLRYGFLAQDILALEGPDSVIIDSEDPEKLRYNGESLIPVLVQAIQELTAKVEALQNGL
jgi:trimeric autotransporter adhesin